MLPHGCRYSFEDSRVSIANDPGQLMFSSSNIAFSSMPVFLPTILQQMGYTDINAQGLSAPVFLVAFVVMLLIARASDKLKTRSTFVCFAALLSCSGYLLIAAGGYYHWPERIRYACLYAATSGFFSVITIVITWTMNNQETNASKGVGMTILNVIGQCGEIHTIADDVLARWLTLISRSPHRLVDMTSESMTVLQY